VKVKRRHTWAVWISVSSGLDTDVRVTLKQARRGRIETVEYEVDLEQLLSALTNAERLLRP
jgi:hypothetical protein